MSPGGRRLFLGVTAIGLAARLAHLAFIHSHPYWSLCESWPQSDMSQFLAWARHLAAGDWLDRDTFRAWFGWQEEIAPREVWDSWYGARVYYQPPLYPYLLAALLKLTGSLEPFRFGQILLGSATCGTIALLGSRLMGRATGWAAGIGAALYAPFIFYDAELLRGTVVVAAQSGLLLALACRRPAWAGAAFGVAWLADPSILLFAPAAAFWLWLASRREAAGQAAARFGPPALFAAAALLAISPLMARNAIVGAPLLSSTTRAPLGFVMGNAPDARPAGAIVPDSTGPILRRAGYSMTAVARATLELYEGRWGALAAKQWEKLRALWGAYEIPDNPSFYYAARLSPAVRFGLRFLPVAALGLVGLALVLPRLARDPDLLLLPLYLVSFHGLFLLAHVVSRYRQPMMIALLVLAGHAGIQAALRLREGPSKLRIRGALTAVAAVGVALLLPHAPPEGYGYNRPAEFLEVAKGYEKQGRLDLAARELLAAADLALDEPAMRHHAPLICYRLGELEERAGRPREAVAAYRRALALDPADEEAAGAIRRLEADPR